MKKGLFLGALLFCASFIVHAVIPGGHVTFIVTDQNGDPIKGVEIVIHSQKTSTFEKELTTNKKGEAKILLPLADYTVDLTKEGYQPFQKIVRPNLNGRMDVPITMMSLDTVTITKDPEKLTGKDKAVAIFNNTVPLLKAGNDAEALPMLEEALAADPTLVQALFHVGRIYLIDGELEKSEQYLTKTVELDSTMDSVYAMLAELYKRKGDEANYQKYLAEAESRGAVSAGEYYNQAAELINAGKDADARPLLEKAISVDPNYADAYYQLGMCLLRVGEIPGCIENMKKYLELEPEGSHAQECKDFIAALGSM